MTVGVLTTCHTQYTWDRSKMYFFYLIEQHSKFFTCLTGALYVNPLWFYKHQHDNRVRSTQNAFSLLFAAILVNCAPSREMHNYCTPHIIKENSENFLIHRCNYILLSQVYCVWQVVKTPTIISNNPCTASQTIDFVMTQHGWTCEMSGNLCLSYGNSLLHLWCGLWNTWQDRKCRYNVTLRRVRATIVAIQKQ